jgi:hypothetical protein
MREATKPMKKSKGAKNGQSDESSDEQPSLSERAQSGMRIAEHLQKAAEGGKLRRGFSLWRVSRELPTAAAGAGELFKRHPISFAIAGGMATTAALLLLAQGMGAFDAERQDQDQEEGDDENEPAGDEE